MLEENTEEYLKKHIQEVENKNKEVAPTPNKTNLGHAISNEMDYHSFDCKKFPCGIFYPTGTTILVRAAKVSEVQLYSEVMDDNPFDIAHKMNNIIMSCVKIKNADGTYGSYVDIKENDRFFLLFLIRELTFQRKMYLTVNHICECGEKMTIELAEKNFEFYKLDKDIEPYFDFSRRCFTFEVNNKIYNLSMSNIGIQKCLSTYVKEEIEAKRPPNVAYIKIMSFMYGDRNTISVKEIKEEIVKFGNMDLESFQFLNSAITYLTFGIEKLKKKCVCGLEVRTDMVFPDRAADFLVVPDAFKRAIKK
jgi:hypothetical protein